VTTTANHQIAPTAADEVEAITRQLIRFDTANFGQGEARGERSAAEYVVGLLEEVGVKPELIESEPGRASVVARIEGRDPSRPALVLHGHLDVVPAEAADWQVDPFEAAVEDGLIWGRGAVDMKGMDAVFLSVIRERLRAGRKPNRDIVLAMFADEEAGGPLGAAWLTRHRPELFAGATQAISEVGGFSVTIAGRRAYLVQTAEKGMAWLDLVARGTAGHGSALNSDNAVTELAAAVVRIAAEPWAVRLTPTVERLLRGVADLAGLTFDAGDPASIDRILDAMGPARRFTGSSIQTLANPTRFAAGYKTNVIPATANAGLDVRPLPGDEESVLARIKELAGDRVDVGAEIRSEGIEVPSSGAFFDTMTQALVAEDPEAVVLPYMLSAGTDNKLLARLGIAGYGFSPLRLPPDLDFTALFHGVDERIPIASLRFGTRVIDRLLDIA
jgi:acetylornithine deacetylase/succinyl-diaminopimelate desuccinylase-like protein